MPKFVDDYVGWLMILEGSHDLGQAEGSISSFIPRQCFRTITNASTALLRSSEVRKVQSYSEPGVRRLTLIQELDELCCRLTSAVIPAVGLGQNARHL